MAVWQASASLCALVAAVCLFNFVLVEGVRVQSGGKRIKGKI